MYLFHPRLDEPTTIQGPGSKQTSDRFGKGPRVMKVTFTSSSKTEVVRHKKDQHDISQLRNHILAWAPYHDGDMAERERVRAMIEQCLASIVTRCPMSAIPTQGSKNRSPESSCIPMKRLHPRVLILQTNSVFLKDFNPMHRYRRQNAPDLTIQTDVLTDSLDNHQHHGRSAGEVACAQP